MLLLKRISRMFSQKIPGQRIGTLNFLACLLLTCSFAAQAEKAEPATDSAQTESIQPATEDQQDGQVVIPLGQQAPDKQAEARPERGMSEAAVTEKYGQPEHSTGAVGTPPISKWTYKNFVVYFESGFVIHSVLKHQKTPEPQDNDSEQQPAEPKESAE